MRIPESSSERARANASFETTFVLTLLGVFVVILLVVWMIAPLLAPGVWPLLDSIETRGGRKAPATEQDLFVSVAASGDLFLGDDRVSFRALVRMLEAVSEFRTHAFGKVGETEVFVRVDKGATFGAVRVVAQAAQIAKRRRLTFLATPIRDDEYNLATMWR